jgi:hypothetical protein
MNLKLFTNIKFYIVKKKGFQFLNNYVTFLYNYSTMNKLFKSEKVTFKNKKIFVSYYK